MSRQSAVSVCIAILSTIVFTDFINAQELERSYTFPRIRDTLDDFAWNYFGLFPDIQGVKTATVDNAGVFTMINVETAVSDTAIRLDPGDSNLLSLWIENYEAILDALIRSGDSPDLPILAISDQTTDFSSLLKKRMIRRPTPAPDGHGKVTILTKSGKVDGVLLFISDSTIYLRASNTKSGLKDYIRVININEVMGVHFAETGSFYKGFLIGFLAGTAIISTVISDSPFSHNSGTDYNDASICILSSAVLALPIGLFSGCVTWLAGSNRYDFARADMPAAIPLLRGWCRFPSAPPIEFLPSMTPQDRIKTEELRSRKATAIVVSTGASSATDADKSCFHGRMTLRLDYGINLYMAGSRNNGLWTGASAAVAFPLLYHDGGMPAIALSPRIGGGIDYLLAGIDLGVRISNQLEIFTCFQWQRFVEKFGSFGWHWGEHLENGTLQNNLFAGGGILFLLDRWLLEFRLAHCLGSPVRAESWYYNDWVNKSYLSTSVSVGWNVF